jgi:hypothetical protein
MAQLKLRMALERRVVARKAEREAESGAKIPTGGGSALDGGLRKKMESQLGADLSSARIHTGGESAAAARSFGARAFTVGNDVHFNAGEFKPGTKEGDRLIAHELTHVVQGQQSGPAVARKEEKEEKEGGEAEAGEHKGETLEVSQPGDEAEREADAAANQAVENIHSEGGAEAKGEGGEAEGKEAAGSGAEGESKEGGEGDAKSEKPAKKQEKPKIAAKLEGVGRKIYRLAGSTEGVTVQQGLPGAGGSYQGALDAQAQAGGFQRDANLNNADKVALEGELAGAIMRNVQAGNGAEPVYQVSRNVLAYIKEREKQLQISMSQSLQEIVGNPPYYGRMGDKPETEAKVYAATLQTFLETGSGPISQHIGAHGQFLTQIYGKDTKEEGKKLAETKGKQILDSKTAGFQGQTQLLETDGLKKKDTTVELAGTQGQNGGPMTMQPFKDRGRENVNPNAPMVEQSQGIAPAGSGASVDVGQQNQQAHQRGTDVWATQENNLFVQHARLVLDMPLSGGGISGTTAELLQCARIMGIAGPALTQYGLACFAHLGSAGAHSFHEIMSVVALAGGTYVPGDYTIALTMISPEDKQRLMNDARFGRYLGGAPAAAQPPQPQAQGTAGGGAGGG